MFRSYVSWPCFIPARQNGREPTVSSGLPYVNSLFSFLPVSSRTYRCSVTVAGDRDTCTRVTCMYYLSISHVNRYVSDTAVSAVEEKVSRLDFRKVNRCTASGLCCCCTRNADTEVCHNRLCESGTVSSVCQAGAAPYIRITYELCSKVYDRLSQCGG